MMKQDVEKLQNKLTAYLSTKICDKFEVISENSIFENSTRHFYSPFLLALIGIILMSMRNNKDIDILLQRIHKKLLDTENNDGLFNFYGDKKYYFDVDTTAIVNTFFFDYCMKLPNITEVQKVIRKNKSAQGGSIYTWVDRENNNIDWFVNFNVYIFLKKMGYDENKLAEYLSKNEEDFFIKGSRYYKDTTIPFFMIYFYSKQKILNKNELKVSKYPFLSDNIPNGKLILTEISLLNKVSKSNDCNNKLLMLLNENWNKKVVCFNSSKAIYTSRELNAVISLYILNKMRELENG